jgi:hypothetical protein
MTASNLLDRQKNEPEDWYSRGRIIITPQLATSTSVPK